MGAVGAGWVGCCLASLSSDAPVPMGRDGVGCAGLFASEACEPAIVGASPGEELCGWRVFCAGT